MVPKMKLLRNVKIFIIIPVIQNIVPMIVKKISKVVHLLNFLSEEIKDVNLHVLILILKNIIMIKILMNVLIVAKEEQNDFKIPGKILLNHVYCHVVRVL